jgi:hypothetical protein
LVIVILAMISMYANAAPILGMNQMNYAPWLTTIGLAVSIIPAVEIAKIFHIN